MNKQGDNGKSYQNNKVSPDKTSTIHSVTNKREVVSFYALLIISMNTTKKKISMINL